MILPPLVTITLAGVPVGKGRPRSTRAGHTYTPPKTRAYELGLRLAATKVMAGEPPIGGPLSVVITAHMPIAASWSKTRQADAALGHIRPTSKPDVDNIAKNIDALNGIVWLDDSQVVTLTVSKHYSDAPRLVVEVYAV